MAAVADARQGIPGRKLEQRLFAVVHCVHKNRKLYVISVVSSLPSVLIDTAPPATCQRMALLWLMRRRTSRLRKYSMTVMKAADSPKITRMNVKSVWLTHAGNCLAVFCRFLPEDYRPLIHHRKHTGRSEAGGFQSDFAVLSADITAIDPSLIETTVVEETVVAGKTVYRKD